VTLGSGENTSEFETKFARLKDITYPKVGIRLVTIDGSIYRSQSARLTIANAYLTVTPPRKGQQIYFRINQVEGTTLWIAALGQMH
jgi:hypothetical protein